MPEFTEYQPGMFCWFDLATTDAEGAKKFYGELFGWELTDEPIGPEMVYTRISQGGKPVAALYAMSNEMRAMNISPMWMSYISVANADETAARAKELGGTMHSAPFDVMDVGRMGVVQDPTGAHFSIWQPKKHYGSHIANEPVSLCWNELVTDDVDRAQAFYTRLFGYKADTQNMGDVDYTMLSIGDRPAAGMMAITPQMGEGVPPHWAVYLAVDDCDATAKKAESLGGKVVSPPTDLPEIGKMAVIADPQGAVFSVIKLLNPPS
jgi:predicted enzyme related to lactoylglutathione lyase